MASTQPRIACATLDDTLRADVLFIPATVRDGKPRFGPLRGLSSAVAARLDELRKAYHGRDDVGAIDPHIVGGRSGIRRVAIVCVGRRGGEHGGEPGGEPGGERDPGIEAIRKAAAHATRWCARHHQLEAAVAADLLPGEAGAAAWAEGAVLADFRYDGGRGRGASEDNDVPPRMKRWTLAAGAAPSRALRDAARDAAAIGEATNLARYYGHEPPNVIHPVSLAQRCRAEAKRVGLKCTILDERKLAEMKAGALLAVGAGSASPPRIIVLEHDGGKKRGAPIALVGKAITLDTGGYSIKPADSMVTMKYDKCGGMAVLGAMVAAARLNLPRRIVGVIATAENMIDGRAYRPGDIVTAMNGTTIEVLNTDAEGRLALADTLCYTCREFKPAAIVDLATLTGACVMALGQHAAAMFSTDERMARALARSGRATGERVWPMPLWPAYRKQLSGGDADLKNVGGRGGGAVTAAAFLREFVDDNIPWTHLDIAGTASSPHDSVLCPKGATGFGVRLLIDWLRSGATTGRHGAGEAVES